MAKNKRPAPRKSADAPEHKDEQHTRALCTMALDLAEQEDGEAMSERLREQEAELNKLVRKLLNQQKDEVLYSALELARYEDSAASALLRDTLAEAAGTVLLRREGAPAMEINAFAIPVFVRSHGGLNAERDFQDQAAFEALVLSITTAGLESAKAKVVLIRHAYDLQEVDGITYSHLHAMVREAAASLTEKKLVPTPALERSMGGWAPTDFAPDDAAVELRFLLGFALKRADDPFYAIPADEAAADSYFAQRMERYQAWTEQARPLLQRCLGEEALELNFLYQDLFFGAKEQALNEYAILQMLTQFNHCLQEQGLAPAEASVIAGPAALDEDIVLRVNLYRAGEQAAPLASCELPLDPGSAVELLLDDVRDALDSIAVRQFATARRFSAAGLPEDVQAAE